MTMRRRLAMTVNAACRPAARARLRIQDRFTEGSHRQCDRAVAEPMNPALAGAVFDELLPGWREARRVGPNRELRAPYRDDNHPSLHVHEEGLVWIDRATGEGGGAWDLARKMRGEDGARDLLRRLDPAHVGTAPRDASAPPDRGPARVEVLGPPTAAQVAALQLSRRLREPSTIERIGVTLVRWAKYEGGRSEEWLGFPGVGGSWKLWAVDAHGRPRLEKKKLERRNAGPVDLIVSPALRDLAAAVSVPVLLDVEGESDLIAAVEARFAYVLTGTGGAGVVKGHDANQGWLRALKPGVVIVWGDLDDTGRAGAETRAAWWLSRGVLCGCRRCPLPSAIKATFATTSTADPRSMAPRASNPSEMRQSSAHLAIPLCSGSRRLVNQVPLDLASYRSRTFYKSRRKTFAGSSMISFLRAESRCSPVSRRPGRAP